MRLRAVRTVATLVATALGVAYLVWKVDFGETVDVLADAHLGWFLLSFAIVAGTVLPMAWRWSWLLAAKGVHDRLPWLTRSYFVAYAAGQFLPTSVGGDAVRILETSRRHPGNGGTIAASVLLERAIGGAATLALGLVGFALALGSYDLGAYLWLEGVFVLGTIVLGVVFFSRRIRRVLAFGVPVVRRLRIERPVRAVYEGVHGYRNHARVLVTAFALTLVVQALRILSIWTSGKAAGVDLSWRPYFVMGPLLFLVMLVPFTINGLAVREAFFVSFLGTLGVAAEPAFATGFLYFLLTIMLALPGGAFLLWEGVRGGRRAAEPGADHG